MTGSDDIEVSQASDGGGLGTASAYVEDRRNDPGLRHLVEGLTREGGFIDGGPEWVMFLTEDAYVEAAVKPGLEPEHVLSIDAYLLRADDALLGEQEVQAWIDRQPSPALGVVRVGTRDREGSVVEFLPVLSVDVYLDSVLSEFVRELVFPFAEAWDKGSVAMRTDDLEFGPEGFPYRVRPAEVAPRNAWLLMGDEASYPTPADLDAMSTEGQAGIFDTEWTAPKNGELGDLALIYFQAPRKAACFVARLASRPYWQTDLDVKAARNVERHQWWASLTPLIEIEPIPYAALQEAAEGFLPLRGRSGHYLSPATIKALRFVAKRPERQAEVDHIAQVPVGSAELPKGEETTFEEWRHVPGGLLPLEAKVSEHIVRPLLEDFVFRAPHSRPEQRLDRSALTSLAPEFPVPVGYVDFVFEYGFIPALAVEVKLTILRPASGLWNDSPDFRQLQRYMAELGVPGLLVDAQRILLVRLGKEAPFAEVVRAEATWKDIALIRDLILEGWGDRSVQMSEGSPPGSSPSHPRRALRRGR